jgi:hypothetical protein
VNAAETKFFEIRDSMTMIPAIGVLLNGSCGPLARRAGYGEIDCVLLTYLVGQRHANHDPYAWGDRTMKVAHDYIARHWGKLASGAVVDVEYILGETRKPKESEQ